MATPLRRDLGTAWRGLIRMPGLAVAAVLSLALGIGANLTAFGLLRAIEFPVVPYPDAGRLVQIDASNEAKQARGFPLSLPDYQDLAARAFVFRDAGVSTDELITLEDGAEPVRLGIKRTSPSYFTTLGTPAELGRPFSVADSASGSATVVVLSHRVWAERYGSDPRMVGRALRLDGQPFTVVGVMPARFDENVEAWIPLAGTTAARDDRRYTVVGRLRAEVPLERAGAEVQSLARALETEHPATNRGWTMSPTPLQRLRSRESGGGYYQLQAAVGVLLFAACANIANLLLARSVSRRRELAVRSALGASRGELARLILLEGVLLALGGGALGVFLASWGVSGAAILGDFPPSIHVPFDVLTVLAALGLSLVAGVLIGFLPALDALRFDVTRLVRAGSARATDSRRQVRLRSVLVAAEVACALVLGVGASLMARSLWNRQQRQLGFEPHGAVKGTLSISESAGATERARATVQRIGQALETTPGVASVGFVGYPIPTRLGAPIPLRLASATDDALGADVARLVQSVTPDYFAAMGTRMRAGRPFAAADLAGAARVAIVNEELARRVWMGRDPLGQEIALGTGSGQWQSATIIGVVSNTLRSAMHDRVLPSVFLPFDQFPAGEVTVVARSTGAAAPLVSALKRAVFQVDPRLVVDEVQTLESDWAAFMRPTRLYATLLSVFAALALTLAAIGVFASMAYSTSQRTRELGIRMALGADGRALVRLVLRQGLRLAIAGIVIGVGASLAGTRMISGLLYGVNAIDPLTVVATAALLLVVVMAACWIPARRTAALNPASVLRAD